MIYDVPAIATLARQCAPEIAVEAMVPLVMTESRGDALRINVNKGPTLRSRSVAEGAAIVRRYIAAGYTVDVGLAQINSATFVRLNVSVEQVFDPCTNLRLASSVLQHGFTMASRHYAGLDAISATYSLYNTGTLTRGMRNGYVGKIWSAATAMGSIDAAPSLPVTSPASATPKAPAAPRERADAWVFGAGTTTGVEVFP